MKLEKKHLIAGGIGLVTITGAILYLQYKRLMNYCIGVKNVKPNALTPTNADIDLYLNFQNKSDLKFEILGQSYNVYINDKLIATSSSTESQLILPKSNNLLKVNVKFNPAQSGKNLLNAMLQLGNTQIRVDMKLKVKLWVFTVNIPYTYITTIKDLMSPAQKNQPSVICK